MNKQFTYCGFRDQDLGAVVYWQKINEPERHALPLRLDLANHSPTGLEWGYGGSGPSQLALAILSHHFHVSRAIPVELADIQALRFYQQFKWAIIDRLGDNWTLTNIDIENILNCIDP